MHGGQHALSLLPQPTLQPVAASHQGGALLNSPALAVGIFFYASHVNNGRYSLPPRPAPAAKVQLPKPPACLPARPPSGNNECFEPYTSNIYVRRVLSGEFTVVNQHLLHDLNRLGLWNPDIKNELVGAGVGQGVGTPGTAPGCHVRASFFCVVNSWRCTKCICWRSIPAYAVSM